MFYLSFPIFLNPFSQCNKTKVTIVPPNTMHPEMVQIIRQQYTDYNNKKQVPHVV